MWEIPVQLVKYFYYNICICVFWVNKVLQAYMCFSKQCENHYIKKVVKEFSIFAIIRLIVKNKYYKVTKTLQRRNCLTEFLFPEWSFVIIGKGRHIEYISQRNIRNRNKSCCIFIWVEVSFCYLNDNRVLSSHEQGAQNWLHALHLRMAYSILSFFNWRISCTNSRNISA